ncbi:MAG TPA: FecR domain-containing protein [Sphingomicrobium sp.]|nr:FecR domain-containing protein [Sphingomicrobium sp.]
MVFLPRTRERIRREASDWVARLGGQARAEDHAAFQRWRAADPRHAEAYDRIAAIWHQAGRLARGPAAGDAQVNVPGRARAFRLALAASLALAVVVSAILLGSRSLPGSPSREPAMFAAATGEIRQVELPDGSRLTLDSASIVEAAFTRNERALALREGRARFQVAQEARPFVVRAGFSEIIATGTLFDVSLIGKSTTVLLLEGSVEVRDHRQAMRPGSALQRLKPGEKLILAASAPAERRAATPGEAAWPTRMLEFDDTRLDEAAALVNRYSKVQLRLGDERVRSLRVSGAFRAGDVAAFAQSLAAAFGLRVVRQPDGDLLLVNPGRGHEPPAP